jgi:hypothetical protein
VLTGIYIESMGNFQATDMVSRQGSLLVLKCMANKCKMGTLFGIERVP